MSHYDIPPNIKYYPIPKNGEIFIMERYYKGWRKWLRLLLGKPVRFKEYYSDDDTSKTPE